jgi:hypothetical protein
VLEDSQTVQGVEITEPTIHTYRRIAICAMRKWWQLATFPPTQRFSPGTETITGDK